MHATLLRWAVNVPSSQASHSRSLIAEGESSAKLPAAQLVQSAHDCWFLSGWNLPGRQSAQVWSVVLVPAIEKYVPAPHWV